jgi:aryl-alcohol dehydrogenase
MLNIKAAVVREKSAPFIIEDLSLDDPRPEEVLVRIVATGVCHTDMVVRDQEYPVPLPLVLGHEGAGIVEKVGAAVKAVTPGDHVVLSYGSCGRCANCEQGKPGYCVEFYDRNFKGARLDGSTPLHAHDHGDIGGCFFAQSSFATHALVTERNAIKIPKDVPLEIMGPLGCGIQTGAGAVINVLKPQPGASLAIFGAGSVGLAAAMAALAVGVTTIIMIDLNDDRLAFARELGVSHTVNGREADTVKAIQKIASGGVDFSLECTGHPKVLRQAVDALRIPGMCGVIGAAPMGSEVSLDINTLLFGRTVRGIIEGDSAPRVFIPQLIELWRTGRFPFDKLIEFFDLATINEAVEASESGRVFKPVIRLPNEGA